MIYIIKNFTRDDSGTTALEYGIMAGLIAGSIIVAVTAIGTNLNGVFGVINNALTGVPGA
jgi:pilus assembly protein Flp/PilA